MACYGLSDSNLRSHDSGRSTFYVTLDRIGKIRGQILQEELCSYLHITQGPLSKIERGKIAPSLEMLILLSDRFHLDFQFQPLQDSEQKLFYGRFA